MKRATSSLSSSSSKKQKPSASFKPSKVASAQAAAKVDANTPLSRLDKAVESMQKVHPDKGESIVYWMRMEDLRVKDNRALSKASEVAKQDNIPLIAIFTLSPQDYIAHDRGARRIDFTLRNLAVLKKALGNLNIPLVTEIHETRRTLPSHIMTLLSSFGCNSLFANMEYEVDELRRDLKVCFLAQEADRKIKVEFIHDRCVVRPGISKSKEGKDYVVYSPYQRQWVNFVNTDPSYLATASDPRPNDASVRHHDKFKKLFDSQVPTTLQGFELPDDDKERMERLWPAGEDVAKKFLDQFLHTESKSVQLSLKEAFSQNAKKSDKHSRITHYGKERDRVDEDTTSRLSPYLSAGVISARTCVNSTQGLSTKSDEIDANRNTGVGRWNQEVAWRDFYNNILACYPRVSMGRPFLEKYATLKWELEIPEAYNSSDDKGGKRTNDETPDGKEAAENLQKWKDGMTGYPIVDAAMRSLKTVGWMHNRLRMIVAMFLTKQLMIDWRFGERYFMQSLIDGDLASNNGGWQWSASTGVDPAPYFRIFNPYSQSSKADPSGNFIRRFVPELAKIQGPEIHKPSAATADKCGYPRPIVDHQEGRDRAIRRFKNPGEE